MHCVQLRLKWIEGLKSFEAKHWGLYIFAKNISHVGKKYERYTGSLSTKNHVLPLSDLSAQYKIN